MSTLETLNGLVISRAVTDVVLHHTASDAGTHSWEEIRQWHLAKGWSDIGYHYGVVLDGGVWQLKAGRDPERQGAHAKGHNQRSIGIAFEGNFERDTLPREAYDIGVALILALYRSCTGLTNPSAIRGHREIPYPTLCPGRNFPVNEIRGAITDQLFRARHH